ncbi:MAG: UDP-N-acetylglucosamine--N-acetylmuramyl-(pentapeptide) pyrophosphoryl-undecaprenol N-acetylglucosamine transferase [Patescibacteria group bacterium]
METINSKKIMFSGGGTGGSVTPLLAVAEELLKDDRDLNLVFVGAKIGPEKELVKNFKTKEIKFIELISGKWRRYFSIYNFLDIFKIIIAFFTSLKILGEEKPALVISAGSFVSVPLVWAAAFYKIPILIHQQDIRPGLANKLMAPFARVVTISFEKSFIDYGPRAVLTGNPIKDISLHETKRIETRKNYSLELDKPLVLVIGGGTGALALNKLIEDSVSNNNLLDICQLVHLTGRGKASGINTSNQNYHSFEFLDQSEVLSLMAAADLVISRCGLGVLTELSALTKATILIPIPNSHQEENAAVFGEAKAAIVLNQLELTSEKIKLEVDKLLGDSRFRGELMNNISKVMKPQAAQNVAALIWEIIKK